MDDPQATVAFLLTAKDDERSAWRGDQSAEPNWWLALLVVAEHRRGDSDADLRRVVELHLWLLRAATRAHALTADEIAIRTAMLVARLRATGQTGAAGPALPSADAATAGCLALMPASPEALPDREDLLCRLATHDETALDTARRSRRAKHLLNAAALHSGHLRDPQLQAQLQSWTDALPHLV